MGEHPGHAVDVIPAHTHMQRAFGFGGMDTGLDVGVGLVVDEQLDDLQVAVLARHVEWVLPVLVFFVDESIRVVGLVDVSK